MNRIITAPLRMKRVLIFDVETTGLLPKKKRGNATSPPTPIPIEEYPHILQLSFAIYDLENETIVTKYDSYINVDDNIEISEFISNLTGITKDMCKTRGKPIVDVLDDFYQAYISCDCLVAHNIKFDQDMISLEIERNRTEILERSPLCFTMFNVMYETMNNIERYCTMMKGINIANVYMSCMNKAGTSNYTKKKFPKLKELYEKLFEGEPAPENLHNSMIDVLVCLKCYLKMQHNIVSKYNISTI